MLCPSCHTLNRENARFCKGCGQTLTLEGVAGQPEGSVQAASSQAAQTSSTPVSSTPLASSSPDAEKIDRLPQAEQRTASSVATEKPRVQATSAEGTRVQQTADAAAGSQDPSDSLSPPSSVLTHHAGPSEHGNDLSAPSEGSDEDVEAAGQDPTQILTPERMHAYHVQRQQREARLSESERRGAIADTPTIITHPRVAQAQDADVVPMTPAPLSATSEKNATGTVPEEHAQEIQQTAEPVAEPQGVASSTEEEDLEPKEEAQNVPVSTEPEQGGSPTLSTTPAAGTQQSSTEDDSGTGVAFPLLAIGATKGDRYEVTQVLSTDEREHVYEVADRKGYLHCWNCGSEQNADGDEFCLDCGAELLNAAYLLHEYPQSGSSDNEAQVLQGNIVNTFVDGGDTYVVEQPQAIQNSFPNGVHLMAACDSDAGVVRRADINEDSTLVLLLERVHESLAAPAGLFVVADGMGGHANGQGASRATIALIAERVVRDLVLPPFESEKSGSAAQTYDDEQIKEILRGAIEEANSTLCQMNQRDKSDAGSTLTGFMMVGDRAFIFNVGDSRTYMLRDEKLYQLTNDHSLVGQLVAGGLIEPEDVYTHPQRNQIFRSIGDKQNVQVDLFTQQVHPGDILLSCSDGLWEMVRDPQIADLLNQAPDPQSACVQLIEAANANGGEDNVSAVIVFVR
jgi:Serine/threonine protein phosphatase